MRTTITLDSDVAALVQKLMADRQLSFKEAVNLALRDALAPAEPSAINLPVYDMGEPSVLLEQALRLAGELEDEEIARKMSLETVGKAGNLTTNAHLAKNAVSRSDTRRVAPESPHRTAGEQCKPDDDIDNG